MISELDLRNRIYQGHFKFKMSSEIWHNLYMLTRERKDANVITIVRDGALKGYAVYSTFPRADIKAFAIMDLCVDGLRTLEELIEHIIERATKEEADFIYLRDCTGSHKDTFNAKGFLSFSESVIDVTLLDLEQLLLSFNELVVDGSLLRLVVKGFNPIDVRVGKSGIQIIAGSKPELTVALSHETFIRLFFGRTTFVKEFVLGRIKIEGLLKLKTAFRFFNIIKQKKWYIPFGDWS